MKNCEVYFRFLVSSFARFLARFFDRFLCCFLCRFFLKVDVFDCDQSSVGNRNRAAAAQCYISGHRWHCRVVATHVGLISFLKFIHTFVQEAFHLVMKKLGAQRLFGFSRINKQTHFFTLFWNVVGGERNRQIRGFRASCLEWPPALTWLRSALVLWQQPWSTIQQYNTLSVVNVLS